MRAPLIAALLLSTALAAACSDAASPGGSGATGSTGAGSTATTPEASRFDWSDDPDDDRVQSGTLEVPVDYDDPGKGTITLFVARHLAEPSQRIGSLLVNPGGPGFGGSTFAISADRVYSDTLLQHFDIIGWDPRGTGLSEPAIDCIDDYDHFYASSDVTPETATERQYLVDLAQEYTDACLAANADILQHVGTNDTARDMNAIREALGEATISFFGFSYGSELGATWATLFPDTVRAAVLDGAVDPTAGFVETSLQQMAGFESALSTFLADCSDDKNCAFHNDGDAEGAFDRLMDALDAEPIPSDRGRPDVNLQIAVTAASEAMYSDRLWPQLAAALADAQQGDGSGLLELHDMYFQREADGSYSNGLEAFQVIFCMDHAERLTVEEDDATVDKMLKVAPRLAPYTTGSYFCTFFPPSTDPRAAITGKGAGPILVMGTTGDSATPLDGTRAMADALEDGRLVIVTGNQHTGYNVSDCSQQTVDDYLVDPVANAPVDGTECS